MNCFHLSKKRQARLKIIIDKIYDIREYSQSLDSINLQYAHRLRLVVFKLKIAKMDAP